jgi:hypothetical protein
LSAIGIIIKSGIKLTSKIPTRRLNPIKSQEKVLIKLLKRADKTIFGKEYNFDRILKSKNIIEEYKKTVPIHNYEDMLRWWQMSLNGESSVCWPGKVQYFALSSGTSSGSSKYIPVTNSMLKAIQRSSIRQISSLGYCDFPDSFYEAGLLMLGGSTNLEYNGIYYAGDLSGITTGNIPFWFQPYHKPGKAISQTKDWQEKLNLITEQAPNWDVSAILGVPSWYQILLERIIEKHKVNNIHEIWPNLTLFVYGGVAFEPYKKSFEKLLGKPMVYLETYLASEGYMAYQTHPNSEGMRMILKGGIYFEFVPFNRNNFDEDGNIKPDANALGIADIKENVEYALLLSTCAGAWRYLIGDVIRFTNKEKSEIKIVGRTKHYLSLCGEHMSLENMNKAVNMVSEKLNIKVKEFTVVGESLEPLFAHHWYLSVEDEIDPNVLRNEIDEHLKILNDDYRVERQHALKEVKVTIVPNEKFLGWLKKNGKEGAQIKFPRVLKKHQIDDWVDYIQK